MGKKKAPRRSKREKPKKRERTWLALMNSPALQRFNALGRRSCFLSLATSIEVWKKLEAACVREKLVTKSELSRSPGARANGPGLRFKTWLSILIHENKEKKAGEVLEYLEALMDLAWKAFEDILDQGKAI